MKTNIGRGSFGTILGMAMGWLLALAGHAETLFTVRQTFTVTNVPTSAWNVRGWFWMPEDRPEQRVLDFRIVEGPESVRITRDPRYGRSWIYAEAPAAGGPPLRVVTEFKVLRRSVGGRADANAAGVMTPEYKRSLAAEMPQIQLRASCRRRHRLRELVVEVIPVMSGMTRHTLFFVSA